jgi:large subunit ribosomal protein L26e
VIYHLPCGHQVYRAKFVVHIERLTIDKSSGATVPIGIHPSNLQITALHLDADRKTLLGRKDRKSGETKAADMETEKTA